MKRIILVLIALLFNVLASQLVAEEVQGDKSLSDRIFDSQMASCDKEKKDFLSNFQEYRTQIAWLNEISNNSDTIYMVESYYKDVEVGRERYSGTMWHASASDTYSSYIVKNNSAVKTKENLFNDYLLFLVNDWDIKTIKTEVANSQILYPATIFATRIILDGGKEQIDTICFDEFVSSIEFD